MLEISFTEAKAYGCFVKLMERMEPNFPHGTAMDSHLANIQAIIQVSDAFVHSVDSHYLCGIFNILLQCLMKLIVYFSYLIFLSFAILQ